MVSQLSPATEDLAKVVDATLQLLPQADLAAKCATNVVLPTGDVKIADGQFSTNEENYKEFWYSMVGLAGEGQDFDGNGPYVRFQPGGGDQTLSMGQSGDIPDKIFANAIAPPLGTRPAYPGKRPPYNSTFPCYKNPLPNLNGAPTGRPTAAAPRRGPDDERDRPPGAREATKSARRRQAPALSQVVSA